MSRSKKNGALVYMGSPCGEELKEALYKNTTKLYIIDDSAVLWNTEVACQWVEATAIDAAASPGSRSRTS